MGLLERVSVPGFVPGLFIRIEANKMERFCQQKNPGNRSNRSYRSNGTDETGVAPGELHITDRLYNALHGVGDLSPCEKSAVLITMHDHYFPGDKIVRDDDPELIDAYRAGRDEIIHIVERCLAALPGTTRAILQCWLLDVHEYHRDLVAGIKVASAAGGPKVQ